MTLTQSSSDANNRARQRFELELLLQRAPAVHLGATRNQAPLSVPIVRLGRMQLQKWHRARLAPLVNFLTSRKHLVCRAHLVILPRKAGPSVSNRWPRLR